MKLKIMQLNMWFGKFLPEIVDYINQTQPDVITFQEITSGESSQVSHGVSNAYQVLAQNLDMIGVFVPSWKVTEQKPYYLGLAIFSRLPIVRTWSEFYYKNLMQVRNDEFGVDKFPGNILSADIDLGSNQVRIMTTHFIWSLHPEINNHQRTAIGQLTPIISSQDNFILTGDFNVTDDSEIFTHLAGFLTDDRPKGVINSLHPQIHKLKGSKQLAVDYVFHKGTKIRVISSDIPVVPLSDHLPVVVEYEIA